MRFDWPVVPGLFRLSLTAEPMDTVRRRGISSCGAKVKRRRVAVRILRVLRRPVILVVFPAPSAAAIVNRDMLLRASSNSFLPYLLARIEQVSGARTKPSMVWIVKQMPGARRGPEGRATWR